MPFVTELLHIKKYVNIIIAQLQDLLRLHGRLDGKPLDLFDTIVQGISTKELIKKGNIANFEYYAPDLHINFDDVDVIAGEYNNEQLTNKMCKPTIYGDILSRIMDAFSAIVSNNQNTVMQFLTSITLIMSISTIVSGFFGMNVPGLPFANNPHGFWLVFLVTCVISLILTFIMSRNKLL